MNKTEFIAAVAEKAGLTKADSKRALDAMTSVITEAMKKDDKVTLLGFGTFSVTKRTARQGVNPQTKKKITIPARKAVKFKAGSGLDLMKKNKK